MYKYIFTDGKMNVKTPKVNDFKDIKIEIKQHSDCIENHSIYPNGLEVFTKQYSDKIEWLTNKRIILLEDCSLGFED